MSFWYYNLYVKSVYFFLFSCVNFYNFSFNPTEGDASKRFFLWQGRHQIYFQ